MKAPKCPICKANHYSHEDHQWGKSKERPVWSASKAQKPQNGPITGTQPAPGKRVSNEKAVSNTVSNSPVTNKKVSNTVTNKVSNKAAKVKQWRSANQEEYREYMREYMRRYRKK